MVIFDDLLSLENCATEKSREKLLNWIRAEVLPAIDPFDPVNDPYDREKVIVIGTRKHRKDWYSMLLNSPLYEKVLSITVKNGKYLWPEKFTKKVLELKKVELGPRLYAQEYMNEVAPAEGLLLKREWIKTYEELPPKQFLTRYMGIDLSMGKTGERTSSLAVAVIAHDTRPDFNHIYVLDLFKEKLTLYQQLKAVNVLYDKWQPDRTNVESVFVNEALADDVRAEIPNSYPIDYVHKRLRGTAILKKEHRIKNLIGYLFEEGRVSMKNPNYDDATRQLLETEYIEFPDGEMDLLDALNLAVDQADLRKQGTAKSFMRW